MEKYHETASYYNDKLELIRKDILSQIESVAEKLGGRICLRYYHDELGLPNYNFFEAIDDFDGATGSRLLFTDTLITNEFGVIEVMMHDIGDNYMPYRTLSGFDATEALYLLDELENILKHIEDTGEKPIRDWEPGEDVDED